MTPSELIRRARHDTGLTQDQLARRLGISQAALARLERPGANPTVRTLERTLRATGHRLELDFGRVDAGVDEDQLRYHLAMTPEQRLRIFEAAHGNLADLSRKSRRAT